MTLPLLERAAAAGASADGPEAALRALLAPFHTELGDRSPSSGLPEGTEQFLVAGAFIVTPDSDWHMLVAGIGFPPEQARLMIPIGAGHPGAVCASGVPLHLQDTEAGSGAFKQYLKTARMGSAIYVPMVWQSRFIGQIVLAARARGSLGPADFAAMQAAGPIAAALWMAHAGDDWLARNYPPQDAFRVTPEGY